jgi:tetratricopeptide (TPR) repeat protein
VTASRVEIVNSANAAFQRGDMVNAAALYDRALNTPPTAQEAPETRAAIDDFARFRAMLALLIAGREDDARHQLDELQAANPDAPLARLGTQLWDQYGMTAQVRGACAQVQPLVASQAAQVLVVLTAAGVNIDANALCTVP